jgi:selenide,water dikinase
LSNEQNSQIKLTQTVQKGGCAAKVAASDLRKVLSRVHFPEAHPELLVDGRYFDDSAIYRVSENLALVQTLDFFTPILDTPHLFGQVAAANALSDVYAMGGEPKTAMGILAFPIATMSEDVIVDVMNGATQKIREAGANLVGGHSIDDDTLKFGLSVTGYVHPEKIWKNTGAREGDVLILTKALGTGTMTAALKRQSVNEEDIREAIESMVQLNSILDLLTEQEKAVIHAATDITGFGLAGHAYQMAKASNVSFDFNFSTLPLFAKALGFLSEGFLTKAHRTNAQYTEAHCSFTGLSDIEKLVLFDPQTSGGLLLSVSAETASMICQKLTGRFAKVAIIGQVRSLTGKTPDTRYLHFSKT